MPREDRTVAESPLKEIRPEPGEHISSALERLHLNAPAFMVFNGARIEAQPGEDAEVLSARWRAAHEELDRDYNARLAKLAPKVVRFDLDDKTITLRYATEGAVLEALRAVGEIGGGRG